MSTFIAEVARAASAQLAPRPRLAPWLSVVDLGDGRIDFRAAGFSYALRHPLLAAAFHEIAPLLDGAHTVEEITSAGGEGVLATTVVFLLKLLTINGCLQEAEPATALTDEERTLWGPQLRLLSRFVTDPGAVLRTLASAQIRLFGSDRLVEVVAEELRRCGAGAVSTVGAGSQSGPGTVVEAGISLAIVCLESPGFATFEAVNAAALETGVRWLRAAVIGPAAQLGPTVVPHHSACYRCFDLRWRSHEEEPDRFVAYQGLPGPPDQGAVGPYRSLVAAQVALEALRLVTGFAPPTTIGRFYELDLTSPLVTPHDVWKVPRCPACGRVAPPRQVWAKEAAPPGEP